MTDITNDTPEAIEYQRPAKAPKNTPFEDLLKLKLKYPDISQRHLGKLVGLSKTAVLMMFQRHGYNWETGQCVAVEEFKKHRADIFAIKQVECLQHMTPEKLKEASVRDLAIVAGTLYDKERLERGLSTSNAAVVYASAVESAFKAKPVDNSVDSPHAGTVDNSNVVITVGCEEVRST